MRAAEKGVESVACRGPAVVGSEATHPCSSAGVAARARICCRTEQALVRRDSGPPRTCLRQSCLQYSSMSLSSRSLSSIGKHSRLLSQNVLPRNDAAQGFVCGALALH